MSVQSVLDGSSTSATLAREPLPPLRPPLLSIIVPTLNERDNVQELVRRLHETLKDLDWEVVFVDDDSTDGTPEALGDLSRCDARVRCLLRIGRRGLSSAVVEGILSTSSPFIAVMDADLQHDESILVAMLERLRSSNYDMVVGSRYADGGTQEGWAKSRLRISRLATKLADFLLHTRLSDPMSGFFILKRHAFDHVVRRLSNFGYKILLDILLSARPPLTVVEVPYGFRNRIHGRSKLDFAVKWEYLVLLLDKMVGRLVPIRFVMFIVVGGFGVFVHMLVLAILNQGLFFSFLISQTAATVVAMTFNFFGNNALTYHDKRLAGFWRILKGLCSFYVICAIGAISNVGIAGFLFQRHYTWWLSGISGILVGAVWNYAVSSNFTWRR
jgi:dolichol-phosphate mannosyltransferase